MRNSLPNPFMPGPIDQDTFLAALPPELVPRSSVDNSPEVDPEPAAEMSRADDIEQAFIELLAGMSDLEADAGE